MEKTPEVHPRTAQDSTNSGVRGQYELGQNLGFTWNREAADMHRSLLPGGNGSGAYSETLSSAPKSDVRAMLEGFSISDQSQGNNKQHSGSFDSAVTGWGNAHKPGDSKEFIDKLPQMEKEGVRYLGMEFLDKKGEALAQRYLHGRAAHEPAAEQSAERRKLLDYLKGQYDSRGKEGRTADDMVKVIEAAGDHHMRVVGLEPGIDHLYSPTNGFREIHAGLRHMTEDQRDSLNQYLDPNAGPNERADARKELDAKLKHAGWEKPRRDSFLHKLDEMRQGDPPLKLPGDLKIPPDPDTDRHPDQAWGALKQAWRNATWAKRIEDTLGDPQHPNGKMVVYAGIGHFESPTGAGDSREGQIHEPPGASRLPDELRKLGFYSYSTFPNAEART